MMLFGNSEVIIYGVIILLVVTTSIILLAVRIAVSVPKQSRQYSFRVLHWRPLFAFSVLLLVSGLLLGVSFPPSLINFFANAYVYSIIFFVAALFSAYWNRTWRE